MKAPSASKIGCLLNIKKWSKWSWDHGKRKFLMSSRGNWAVESISVQL
jgi:hypothetical protein